MGFTVIGLLLNLGRFLNLAEVVFILKKAVFVDLYGMEQDQMSMFMNWLTLCLAYCYVLMQE